MMPDTDLSWVGAPIRAARFSSVKLLASFVDSTRSRPRTFKVCGMNRRVLRVALATACLWLMIPLASSGQERSVDFNKDVLPLLSNTCFECHGPDEARREAGLRLDQREGVFAPLDSGERAIVAGDSQASALYQRITSTDPDLQMPPADSGKSLSAREIATLKNWIDTGAPWAIHWAFHSPTKPSVPPAVEGWASEQTIDRFVQARLQREQLSPEGQADKETLLRRVTLDLTGLPPTISELDAFLADDSPDAYERVVDRLLNSARYGEHLARIWLDAARYADTHGLHLDNERSIWPYRDWVIAAFNRNLPFDQFTIEQLAGDLLPNPSLDQRVATGFNRCNVTTSEGGSIDDEYYVRYAVDRVETTSTVWLGLTAGCAACHDHKFDPLTQKEFYQLFSYFFSLTEKAMDGNALLPPPSVKVPGPIHLVTKHRLEQQLASVGSELEQALGELQYSDPLAGEPLAEVERADVVWFDDELPAGAQPSGDGETPWQFVTPPDAPVYSGKNSSKRTADGLSQQVFTQASEPLEVGPHDGLFAYVYLDPANPPETIQLQFNDGSWEHRAFWGADKGHASGRNNDSNRRIGDLPETGKWVRLEVPAGAVGLNAGAKLNGWAFTQFKGTVYWDQAGLVSVAPLESAHQESLSQWEQFRREIKYPTVPDDIQTVLDLDPETRSAEQSSQLEAYFLQVVNPATRGRFMEPLRRRDELRAALGELEKSIPASLVMEELKEPRQAHLLERGQYTMKRDAVSSRVPEWLLPLPENAPGNRLGLAQWLVDPRHPLTSRVTVNRFWQQLFGTGLVKTAEDFGLQGERPSHPELLDWLATDFVESGWDVKRFFKMLVMSATYRQSSRVTPEKWAADPENRLLARGPRFRLDAEVIRDQALAVSGLLVDTVGGESVRPYQPAGLWEPVGFGGSNTAVFKQDTGPKLYRRSMYTFWKRTSPPPTMSTFDAPDRETCQVRRARTNTPLQALALMNDVQFFEAARKFAERVLRDGGGDDSQRLEYAFRSITARHPNSTELAALTSTLNDCLQEFEQNPQDAVKLISAGESPRNESLHAPQLAAWTMVVHLLMNLNETITKG